MTSAKHRQENDNGLFSYIREAFDTGMNAVQRIHQAGADVPLNILQSAGVSEQKTESFRQRHNEIIDTAYDSIHSVVSTIGRAGVEQVNLLKETLVDDKPAKPKSKAKTKH